MHTFFKPSDISTIPCTISNITRNGSAFAVTEQDEQVYIGPRIVEATGVDIGDFVTAYCLDNHRPESDGQHHQARWRAMRITVAERLAVAPAPAPTPTPAPELSTIELSKKCQQLLRQDRAWSAKQIAAQIGCETQRVSNWLHYQHQTGNVAAAKLYSNGEQTNPSKVFYARDVELLDELIDEVTLD